MSIHYLEREANAFARCLLMPEEMVKSELSKLMKDRNLTCVDLCDDDEPVIPALAHLFEVSRSMMLLRLQEIGLVA